MSVSANGDGRPSLRRPAVSGTAGAAECTTSPRVPWASLGSMNLPGEITVLNGAPRSEKSSIAAVIQERFSDVWMNIGASLSPDAFARLGAQ